MARRLRRLFPTGYRPPMTLLQRPRALLLARAAFFGAALIALVLALLPQPPYVPTESFGDKINHMIGFATLAGLAALAWPQSPPLQRIERLSFFGAFIEVAQSIPVLGRDCEILDWVADTVAVIVVTGLIVLLRRRVAAGR